MVIYLGDKRSGPSLLARNFAYYGINLFNEIFSKNQFSLSGIKLL